MSSPVPLVRLKPDATKIALRRTEAGRLEGRPSSGWSRTPRRARLDAASTMS